MNITVLMGSPRKKDTYRICKFIEETISEQVKCNFEYIFLSDYNILDCKGCDQCFTRGDDRCPNKDDVEIIKDKLISADGIIFATPVYAHQIPGRLKTLCDRLAYLFHRPILVGKPAITITATAGSGIKSVKDYMKMIAVGWGCSLIGEVGIISPQFFEKDNYGFNKYQEKYHQNKENELSKLVIKFLMAIQSDKMHVPTFYDLFMFHGLRSKIYSSQHDYNYWASRGWINSNYYYKIELGPIKSIFGAMLRLMIDVAYKPKNIKEEIQR